MKGVYERKSGMLNWRKIKPHNEATVLWLYQRGWPVPEIAKEGNVSRYTIYRILKRAQAGGEQGAAPQLDMEQIARLRRHYRDRQRRLSTPRRRGAGSPSQQ
jgi:DNA invertase Pin-like site-specific DNA recombinase